MIVVCSIAHGSTKCSLFLTFTSRLVSVFVHSFTCCVHIKIVEVSSFVHNRSSSLSKIIRMYLSHLYLVSVEGGGGGRRGGG